MECRRTFLKNGIAGVIVLSAAPTLSGCRIATLRSQPAFKAMKPRKACVVWYSQTGYTEKAGRLIAEEMKSSGIDVVAGDIRSVDQSEMKAADLIVAGSPVYYYDAPEFVKSWIQSLSRIDGTPVAAYVTFGGPEGNQNNAAYSILEQLTGRGGVPIAMDTFRTMSTYPLSWPEDKEELRKAFIRIEENSPQIRSYAIDIVRRVETYTGVEFYKKLTLREMTTYFNPIWWTKRQIENHSIDTSKCIQCGTCKEKCPVEAIDPYENHVDTDACVLCFGCINNCPVGAVRMEVDGKELIGHLAFMQKHA